MTADPDMDTAFPIGGKRVIELESKLTVLTADVQRLSASHERTDIAFRQANERTEAALRSVTDKISDTLLRNNEALAAQSNQFLARVDAMGSQFADKLGELRAVERDQDKALSSRFDSLETKFASREEVSTLKAIFLAIAGVVGMYAFHKATGTTGP